MCEACESDEPFVPREPVPAAVLTAARALEAALPGDPVPDAAWSIYLGLAGGAVTWPQYQRIRMSYEAALAATPPASPVRMIPPARRRSASIRCESAA